MSYILESHKGAPIFYNCPRCKQHKFQRYVRHIYETQIADNVGLCKADNKCGFHFGPSDYQKAVAFIPSQYVLQSLLNYKENNCFLYLKKEFSEGIAIQAAKRYSIGTSSAYSGASIFWRTDNNNKTHEGKIILIETFSGTGKVLGNVSEHLKLKDFDTVSCLFGEHLLNKFPKKTVVVVENEIAAIVASCKYPDYIWVAGSGKKELTANEKSVLSKRDFIFNPSTWREKT